MRYLSQLTQEEKAQVLRKQVIRRAKFRVTSLFVAFADVNAHVIFGKDSFYYLGWENHIIDEYANALNRYSKFKQLVAKYVKCLGENFSAKVNYYHNIQYIRLVVDIYKDGKLYEHLVDREMYRKANNDLGVINHVKEKGIF